MPQKRQGALSHLIVLFDDCVIKLVADKGTETPAATAVAAIALALIKSRRVNVIILSPGAVVIRHRYDEILVMKI